MSGRVRSWCSFALLTASVFLPRSAWTQQMSKDDRERLQQMLTTVTSEVSKHYYDPDLHGVDWAARVERAKEEISRENEWGAGFADIAAALDGLNDSHTYFIPPPPPYRIDYGWEFQMVGTRCLVTHVRPGSDAEAKGIKPGDEVLAINGFQPTRDNLFKMEYILRILKPQPELNVTLRDLDGHERQINVTTRVKELRHFQDPEWVLSDRRRFAEDQQHYLRPRAVELGDALMVVRISAFTFAPSEMKNIIHKANGHQALIIDVRDNPGGLADTLAYCLGVFFDREVKIGDRRDRNKTRPVTAKSAGKDAFTGRTVVLVDGNSSSAAELFAKVIQLEGRGTVMGDRSAGRVEESRHYMYPMGHVGYGASITGADIIMRDGKSLEHVGVVPDQIVLPTRADLASGRDPVLAQAAASLGVNLSAEAAGKLFPYEWPPDNQWEWVPDTAF